MKKVDTLIKEYVTRLSEDDLQFVSSRCTQLLQDDRIHVLDFMSRNRDMDRLLSSTDSADELFDCLDVVGSLAQKEIKKMSA